MCTLELLSLVLGIVCSNFLVPGIVAFRCGGFLYLRKLISKTQIVQALKVVRNDSDQNEDNGEGGEELRGVIKPKDIQITLVVVDGTWEHAQEMVKASLPFLSKFVTQVCLPFDVRSEGFGVGESDLIIRKEPYGGCVSTMEAVARSLAILEPDGHMVESKLMDVLRKMVSLQALHFSSPKIRPKLKKRSKEGLDMQVDKK